MGFFRQDLGILHIWNGTKRKISERYFCNFLGINTHLSVKKGPKFENKSLLDAKFYGAWYKKISDPKSLTFVVCGLKTSLGQSEPKAFGKGVIKP